MAVLLSLTREGWQFAGFSAPSLSPMSGSEVDLPSKKNLAGHMQRIAQQAVFVIGAEGVQARSQGFGKSVTKVVLMLLGPNHARQWKLEFVSQIIAAMVCLIRCLQNQHVTL